MTVGRTDRQTEAHSKCRLYYIARPIIITRVMIVYVSGEADVLAATGWSTVGFDSIAVGWGGSIDREGGCTRAGDAQISSPERWRIFTEFRSGRHFNDEENISLPLFYRCLAMILGVRGTVLRRRRPFWTSPPGSSVRWRRLPVIGNTGDARERIVITHLDRIASSAYAAGR